jgi:hypothetical protein
MTQDFLDIFSMATTREVKATEITFAAAVVIGVAWHSVVPLNEANHVCILGISNLQLASDVNQYLLRTVGHCGSKQIIRIPKDRSR